MADKVAGTGKVYSAVSSFTFGLGTGARIRINCGETIPPDIVEDDIILLVQAGLVEEVTLESYTSDTDKSKSDK